VTVIGEGEAERRRLKAERLKGSFERRDTPATGLECRTADDGTIRMGGWASVTGVTYSVGSLRETIAPGAFRRTLGEGPKVCLLVNHEGLPLASTGTDTLRLSEDKRGLRWDAELDPEDPESASLARKVARGLVTDASFAFMVNDDEWDAKRTHRTIKAVGLNRGDISVVTHGANPHASVALRSRDTSATSLAVLTASNREREQLALLGINVPRRGSRGKRAPDYSVREREQIARLRKGA
jgi:HK97 family phage prohead protease